MAEIIGQTLAAPTNSNELKLNFESSSHSGGGNDCVEVARIPNNSPHAILGNVALRDSKDEPPFFVVSEPTMQALLDTVRIM